MDAWHIIAGVLLQLAGVCLWRRGLRDVRPWAGTATLTFANECYDLWIERWPSLGMQLGEGIKDVLLTLFLPSLLLWLARTSPRFLVPAALERPR